MTLDPSADWRPTASRDALRTRALLLTRIRAFFAARDVLEVETPILGSATVTDVHLDSLSSLVRGPDSADGRRYYLQTSPEYAMKRLLAAGSGSVYQITKAFRDGESGRLHNVEFTLLEWYRLGFDHHRLMDEMDAFLGEILAASPAERMTYGEAFERHAQLDPHTATAGELMRRASQLLPGTQPPIGEDERDGWLDLLRARCVEPRLAPDRPTFIYDFPASQAALARVRPGAPPVAERFEVVFRGIELANGYHELADAAEQRRRFAADQERRRVLGRRPVAADERFLAALEKGLPDCAGVALGIDRLVMLAVGGEAVSEVMSFPTDRA